MTKTIKPVPDPKQPLKSANMEKFAQEVANGASQAGAYRAAYSAGNMADTTLWNNAHKLAARGDVSARIAELRAAVTNAVIFDRAKILEVVLADALAVVQADPAELTRYRRLNCRYCHGMNNAYRWRDEREYWTAMAAAADALEAWEEQPPNKRARKRPELPLDDGGYGFRKIHLPNPDCPECEGEGIEDVRIADTLALKGPARALYNGVKQTKNGIEVLQRSKEDARAILAKFAGLQDSVSISGGLAVAAVTASVTPEQAAAIAKRLAEDF